MEIFSKNMLKDFRVAPAIGYHMPFVDLTDLLKRNMLEKKNI